jgi:hypothetical protein
MKDWIVVKTEKEGFTRFMLEGKVFGHPSSLHPDGSSLGTKAQHVRGGILGLYCGGEQLCGGLSGVTCRHMPSGEVQVAQPSRIRDGS